MRAATVTAIAHMITYAISRDRLRELVARSPATREWMLEEIRRRYPASGLVP
jgi:CRP-like cAMP-binding protein